MEIENLIKESVLDQDHLADLLKGNEKHIAEIMNRVQELIRIEAIEIYTYEDDKIIVISKHKAEEVVSKKVNWSWKQPNETEENYFLSPIKRPDGSLVYGN